MSTFRHATSQARRRAILRAIVLVGVAMLVVVMAERLINKGTILGYQVLNKKSQEVKRQESASGTVIGSDSPLDRKSVACTVLSEDTVTDILSTEMTTKGGLAVVPPNSGVSNCIYVSKTTSPVTQLSVLRREFNTAEAASRQLKAMTSTGSDVTQSNQVLNISTNQVSVQRDNLVFTLTLTVDDDSDDPRADLLRRLADAL